MGTAESRGQDLRANDVKKVEKETPLQARTGT
jgi:hypothetical protein